MQNGARAIIFGAASRSPCNVPHTCRIALLFMIRWRERDCLFFSRYENMLQICKVRQKRERERRNWHVWELTIFDVSTVPGSIKLINIYASVDAMLMLNFESSCEFTELYAWWYSDKESNKIVLRRCLCVSGYSKDRKNIIISWNCGALWRYDLFTQLSRINVLCADLTQRYTHTVLHTWSVFYVLYHQHRHQNECIWCAFNSDPMKWYLCMSFFVNLQSN